MWEGCGGEAPTAHTDVKNVSPPEILMDFHQSRSHTHTRKFSSNETIRQTI